MSPSTNTRSGPTLSIESIGIFPTTPPIAPYITRSDLDEIIKYIHADIKENIYKTDTNIKP